MEFSEGLFLAHFPSQPGIPELAFHRVPQAPRPQASPTLWKWRYQLQCGVFKVKAKQEEKMVEPQWEIFIFMAEAHDFYPLSID